MPEHIDPLIVQAGSSPITPNPNMLNRDSGQGPKQFLLGVGIILILVGAAMLVYLGIFIFDAIVEPQGVGIIDLILTTATAEGRALAGRAGGFDFELWMNKPISTLLFLLVSVWALAIVAGILRSIIATGRELVKTAKDWPTSLE